METKKEKSVMDKMHVVKITPSKTSEKNATTELHKVEEKRAEQTLSLSQLLEKQLSEIKRKKQLADRRDIFLKKSKELEECLSELNQEQGEGNFTTDNFTLIFTKKNGYRDDDAFKISNPSLMTKFLVALQSEIKKAINGIENELLRDL